MISILSTRRFALWTRELRRWLSAKFESISIDLTPVEDKLDEVKSDVAAIQTALTLIGTPASGQPATLFEAIAEGGGGELELATDAEYAVFKSHMETEIANILTPITEE